MMRTLVTLLLVASVAATAAAATAESSAQLRRELEQQQQQQYSGTGYYGACFNVKEYDDDNADDDGNSYFYNGAYRAAYSRYAAFFFCAARNRDRSKDGPMLDDNTCDGPYVTDLGDYMQVVAPFTTNYCNSCKSCRRRLEDEAAEDEGGNNNNNYYVAANCNTCKAQCANFWSDANNYAYEEEDFQCQASYQDGDVEFYSAPQCITGQITLGSFYDEDCKFKTNQGVVSDESAAIAAVFAAAETMTFDCTNNAEVCEALGDISFRCANDNGNAICKAAKQALRTRTFYKKPWYSKFPFGLVLFILIVSGAFSFLSYTYYVRHSQPRKKEPLMEGQHGEEGDEAMHPSSASGGGGEGGLPPKSPPHQSQSNAANLPPFT